MLLPQRNKQRNPILDLCLQGMRGLALNSLALVETQFFLCQGSKYNPPPLAQCRPYSGAKLATAKARQGWAGRGSTERAGALLVASRAAEKQTAP